MKKGIALIELIFAIVIIGITLLAVPNLIATTTKASNQSFAQEAISNAASHIGLAMSQFWDEEATNPKYNNPILVVQDGFDFLDETTDNTGYFLSRRVGVAKSSSRRFAIDINGTKLQATTTLGLENAESEPDDFDDFNGHTYSLVYSTEQTTTQEGDYKDVKISIEDKVNYISDKPTNGTPPSYNKTVISFDDPFDTSKIKTKSTNIKSITVTLTSSNDPNKKVVLKGFSCNIGSSKLKERKF